MAITAGMVKELRELTGAGMMDCKTALTECDGDIKKSIDYLREKGLATAAKKSGRIAAEGLVHTMISCDGQRGVVVEVNAETDFVAKNPDFRTFVDNVAELALTSEAGATEELLEEKVPFYDGTLRDAITNKVATIGENITLRRFDRIVLSAPGYLSTYIHGFGKIAVLTQFNCESVNDEIKECAKNICMQIAALLPQYVDRSEIADDFIAKEREIVKSQIINDGRAEGKPEAVVEKMVQGKLDKNLKEICLLDQQYVKDGELTVRAYLESVSKTTGIGLSIARFVCYQTGEGIEKKTEDFAEEVNKAIKG